MSYRQKQSGIKWGSTIGTGVIVLALFGLFVFLVAWFRTPKDDVQDRIDSIADVMTPDPISEAVINGAIDTESREAMIHPMGSLQTIGVAKRGTKDKKYFFEIKSSLLDIDRETFYYEVWLVRPVPYDFISLGEMVTNDDGDFVLEWEAPSEEADYSGYVQIVLTRQEHNGSPDPNVKVAEGEFGN